MNTKKYIELDDRYDYYIIGFGKDGQCSYAISKEIPLEDRKQIHKDYFQKFDETLYKRRWEL